MTDRRLERSYRPMLIFFLAAGALLLVLSVRGAWGAPTVVATVPVGSAPIAVGVNATTNRVYVATYNTNSVDVINGATSTVITTVPVGTRPYGVGVNATTNRVYVANNSSANVSVIDGATNTVIATVPVGIRPFDVGVNATTNRVYVANYTSNTVSVIDTTSNTVVATVPVGSGPIGVGVNATTNRVYVANSGTDTVSVINGATNAVVATVPVGNEPQFVGMNAATARVYVSNYNDNNVSVIDSSSNTVVATVAVGPNPVGVGVSAAVNRVYVANDGSQNVSVIDGATNAIVASVPVGASPRGVAVNANTNRVYVANESSNNVTVIEDSLPSGFSVTRYDDPTPDGCPLNGCSLREAISAANAAPGADTILLPAGTFNLSRTGSGEELNATGDLDITGPLTITGAGANLTTINAGGATGLGDRVFHIQSGVTATIVRLTVTGGLAGLYSGGGIANAGILTMIDVIVRGNTASASSGGGIHTDGPVTLTNVTVDDNHADTGYGGGIFAAGPVTLNNSTVSNNSASVAGGISNYINGPLTLNNSTVSGNTGGFAGGIVGSNYGNTLFLNNSTVSYNTGGLYPQQGTVHMTNSILANNGPSGNCDFTGSSTLTSHGYNLSTDIWCNAIYIPNGGLDQPTDLNNTPASLAPLALNGGATKTHALCIGPAAPHPSCVVPSLAIDHIPLGENGCAKSPGPFTDQRGYPRPQDGDNNGTRKCDIGAYEVGNPTVGPSSGNGRYCINGTSTGIGWAWEIIYPTTGGGSAQAMASVPPPLVGASNNDIAQAWASSIIANAPATPGLTVGYPAGGNNCFRLTLSGPIPAPPRIAYLSVNNIMITLTTGGVSFNPTVEELDDAVGGTTQLAVRNEGARFPALPLAAGAGILALLATAAWYTGRRLAQR